MATNATRKATVNGSNPVRNIEVYKLKEGTPTPAHVWCNFSGCTETFTEEQLTFKS